MASSQFNIELIQNHQPGWEDEWNRLLIELLAEGDDFEDYEDEDESLMENDQESDISNTYALSIEEDEEDGEYEGDTSDLDELLQEDKEDKLGIDEFSLEENDPDMDEYFDLVAKKEREEREERKENRLRRKKQVKLKNSKKHKKSKKLKKVRKNKEKKGPLRANCEWIVRRYSFTSSGNQTEIDDFTSYVTAIYHTKAQGQTLFTTWIAQNDSETAKSGNPIPFLCSPKYLLKLYNSFRNDLTNQSTGQFKFRKLADGQKERIGYKLVSASQNISQNDGSFCLEETFEASETYQPENLIEEQNRQNVINQARQIVISDLVFHINKEWGRTYEILGIQFYPDLSQTELRAKKLRDYVCAKISEYQDCSIEEAHRILMEKHQTAQQVLEEKIQQLRIEIKEREGSSRYNNMSNQKALRKIDSYNADALVCPLGVSDIQILLKSTASNAAQCLTRYRDFLKKSPLLTTLQGNFRFEEDDDE